MITIQFKKYFLLQFFKSNITITKFAVNHNIIGMIIFALR